MLSEIEIEKIRSIVSPVSEVAYAMLYGSAVRQLLQHSDIDLLIGGELSNAQKADLSMNLSLELRRSVDIVCSKEARCEVVLRALSSGVPVMIRDKARIREDYFKNYHHCDKEHPLKRIRLERLKRVYGNG